MKSAFSVEFRESFLKGKYIKRAQDLDEPTLEALLWFVGELSTPTNSVEMDALRDLSPNFSKCCRNTALEAIILIQRGVRFKNLKQIYHVIASGIDDRWEEQHFQDPPNPEPPFYSEFPLLDEDLQ